MDESVLSIAIFSRRLLLLTGDGVGRLCLCTKADSVTYFDTVAITPLE